MSRLRCFLPVMKKIIPLGFKYGSGKGWKYVWHKDDPADVYHFECLECFGPMFCHSDIINYGNLHDIFSRSSYGDMQVFVEKLKGMGYERVELIPTDDGRFMTRWEATWMALSGSAVLVGKK